jgi:pimeloyl-ACP methyl ester carboxylesterase
MKAYTLLLIFVLPNLLFAQEKSKISESEIVLNTSTGNIYGTLTVADNVNKTPVIIIIPGSGAPDRDGNMQPVLQTNTYKMLSEKFAESGISSLRYDKRGAGKSKAAITSESELKFENYVDDVVGWINLLKTDNKFSKIILLGHSEGSLTGIIAATKTNVSSFISVAGVGKSVDKLLKEQLKNLPPQLLAESSKIIDSLKAEKTISEVNPQLFSIFRPSVQPYLISWMKYDPAIEITKLKIPLLLIQGTTDLQVTVNDAELLFKSKPDAQLAIIENMNHVLKESSSDMQENSATYRNPELPLKPELVDKIIKFVNIK